MDANDVLDGWKHEDARRVLDAVRHAADGLITKGEMLAKLADAAGLAGPDGFEDLPAGVTVLGNLVAEINNIGMDKIELLEREGHIGDGNVIGLKEALAAAVGC
jgi:hypothetical protein